MIRRSHFAASTLAVAALAVAGLAAPGAADTSAVTVTVSAGALSIDAPATVTGTASVNSTMNLTVADVAVSDARGSLAGWTATAAMTDLVTDDGADPGETIAASTMLWTTTAVTPLDGQVAIAVPAAGSPDVGAVMAVGLPVVSPGGFDIDGQVTINIPTNARAGDYTGTLTTTIS